MISDLRKRGLVNDGDRLVGWGWAHCPTCEKRFYWVYVRQGEGGWYAEFGDVTGINMAAFAHARERANDFVEAFEGFVGQANRIPFR